MKREISEYFDAVLYNDYAECIKQSVSYKCMHALSDRFKVPSF